MKKSHPVLRQVCSNDLLKASRPLQRVASEEYLRAAKLHSLSKRPSEASSEMCMSIEKELSKLATNLHSPSCSISPPMSVASLSPMSKLTYNDWKLKKDFQSSLRRFAYERLKNQSYEARQSQEQFSKDRARRAKISYEDWAKRKAKESRLKKRQEKRQLRAEQRQKTEETEKARLHFIEWLKSSFVRLNEDKLQARQKKASDRRLKLERARLIEQRKTQARETYKQWVQSKTRKASPSKLPLTSPKTPKVSMLAYSPNKNLARSRHLRKSLDELSSISQKAFESCSLVPSFNTPKKRPVNR